MSRLSLRWMLGIGFSCLSCSGLALAQNTEITGTWRGTSECVIKKSSCNDEVNIYRFTKIAEKPGWYSGTGSKVVDGKEIPMGTLEWRYDSKRQTLESESSGGVFLFNINGDTMEGSLTLRDNTAYRYIHLKKNN